MSRRQPPDPARSVQDFLDALRQRWPLLPPLGDDASPQSLGDALGRLLTVREAQFARLRAQLDTCQAARMQYHQNWQDCRDAPR